MKAALVTIRNEIKNMYYEELNSIFSGYLEILPYSIEVDHKYMNNTEYLRSVDVILLTNPKMFSFIKDSVKENCKILYLDYAFLKNKIESLKDFPNHTKALVCFNYYEVSVQAVTTIYEMGFTNLDLTIYNPEEPIVDEDYDVAIVGESSAIVPEKIEKIFSLGRRKISFKTLIDLAVTTNILDDKLENKIYLYSQEIANPNNFVNHIFTNSSYSKVQLQTIMDSIDYSIIILNSDFQILNYNMNLKEMFSINKDILNMKAHDIQEFIPIIKYIVKDNTKNLLVEIQKNKRVMLTVQKIYNMIIKKYSYVILIRDVTEIMLLESTLKRQLEKKGHITKHDFSHIYGNSSEIKECIHKAKIIAKLDKTALIIGESGTGKELFAQSMHNASPRKNFSFIGINCAALPSNLLESELFGYEKGTFTGGLKDGKAGLFEIANNGTLFLDEIGDMSLITQAKVLRVIEEKEFMRLGGNEIISVNVRIIAATNRNLRALIKEGNFRLDLYYRLNALMFTIPPLRKRKDDIKELIHLFTESNTHTSISEQTFDFLVNHTWEGNVRELKNCIDYMVSISNGEIKMKHLPDYILEEIDEYKIIDNTILEDDIFSLLNSYEKKIIFSLIRIIGSSGGGRRSIFIKLKLDYADLSEYKLRNLIDLLVQNNLVEIGSGRSGLSLTDTGKKMIELS